MRLGILGTKLALAALLLAPVLANAEMKRFGAEWRTEPSDLSKYGSIKVSYGMQTMLKTVEKSKEGDMVYRERGEVVEEGVRKHLDKFAGGFKGTAGGPALMLHAEMTRLWTGSGAMRAFAGIPGYILYMLTLKEGDKVVGQLEIKSPVTRKVSGAGNAAGKAMVKYLKKKM